jgi:hypothetical protein
MSYDVAVYQGADPDNSDALFPSLFDEEGLSHALTGPLMVAHQFLVELYTITGSVPGEPDRGVDFYAAALSGRLRTVLDVKFSFAAAELQIRNRLRLRLDGTEDPADVLSRATLTNVLLDADRLVLYISITTDAGETAKVELPIVIT